jgi:hypothetical protein
VANKDIGKDELLNLIRAAHASATGIVDPRGVGEAKAAMKRLRGMETGKQHALHEELVHRILTVILHPHLTNPASQAKTAGGRQRRDVLFSNRSPHLFWQSMRQKHDATQIVFELKNVKKLRPEHIRQTAAYLTAGLGRLGFVVSRTPASARMIEHAVDVFRTENQKVVLFLCDDHLEQMLNKKAAGRDPTEVIEKVYDDFIRHT